MGFPTKVQLIKRKASEQWYINFPSAIAQAMEFSRGETVEWIVEDKALLALRRLEPPPSALKKPRRPPPAVRATLERVCPRLPAAPRRRARTNTRAEFASLSRTLHRDRTAHHFRLPVPGLERPLSTLLAGSSSPARDLLRRPPRHRQPASRGSAVSRRPRRFPAAPLRSPYAGCRLAARPARAAFSD